nr:glycosyltransferase [Kiritimatiellia bacterium]
MTSESKEPVCAPDGRLHIACAADERYVRPLCGMLSSLFAHNDARVVTLHVLTDGLSAPVRARFEGWLDRQGSAHELLQVPAARFGNLRLHYQHFSTAVFFRILIPELIASVERVLYLDADILVRRS